MDDSKISITLGGSEALVLFDWLSRLNEEENAVFEDRAEQIVLWDLECSLERLLVAPLRADYPEALGKARDEVRDPE
jgi:hypothetical protein